VFHDNPKVPAEDRRVFKKFAAHQQYDNLHYATQALRSIEQGVRWLAALEDASVKLLASGLLGTPNPVANDVEKQRKLLAALAPVMDQLRQDRTERLKEVSEMEDQLHQEYRSQQRAHEIKRAKEAKALQKQAAEQQLAEREEPTVPGVDLDPTLLAQSVKALNLHEKRKRKAKKEIPAP
jgi:hypothetical protein